MGFHMERILCSEMQQTPQLRLAPVSLSEADKSPSLVKDLLYRLVKLDLKGYSTNYTYSCPFIVGGIITQPINTAMCNVFWRLERH